MSIRSFLRQRVLGAARTATGATIFSSNKRIRSLGFFALGAKRSLVVCEWPAKETFIASTRDEIIARELFVTGEFDFAKFEAAFALAVRQSGRKPRVLVDVGANIGTICIPAVARGFVERAIAIEPEPQNCRLLKANLQLNGVAERIAVHEAAAGARDGEVLVLELSDYNLGDHKIRPPGVTGVVELTSGRAVEVTSRKLDSILESDTAGDEVLIWIDVQGFEGYALSGCAAVLARRPPLVMEFWPAGMARTGSFPLVKEALAHYERFSDLEGPEKFRPISELQGLYEDLGEGGATTDILVL